jgi:hypothetical protein
MNHHKNQVFPVNAMVGMDLQQHLYAMDCLNGGMNQL